jgi:hypothetical protein
MSHPINTQSILVSWYRVFLNFQTISPARLIPCGGTKLYYMASVSYRGEEWQLTNKKGGQSRCTDRWTDRIKLDLSFGRDKPIKVECIIPPKVIDTLKVYKDRGATKTKVTFLNKGCKSEIVLLRVVGLIKLRGMFPTRTISVIEYLK